MWTKKAAATCALRRQVARMDWLVESLLKLAKLDAGTARFCPETIPLSALRARAAEPFTCFIDPDDPRFSTPGDLPERIRDFCRETGQPVPESVGAVVRCIYESLAMKYRFALDQISARTGRQFNVLHLLGGGTKDGFLCQMTADSLAFPVIAGPTEATALGNMLLQLIALNQLPDVAAGRELICKTETLRTYEPKPTAARDRAYRDFQNILR